MKSQIAQLFALRVLLLAILAFGVSSGDLPEEPYIYSDSQLSTWLQRLRKHWGQFEGDTYHKIDHVRGRVVIGVLTEQGKSRLLEIAREENIPRNAIYVDIHNKIGPDFPLVNPTESGIEISVGRLPNLIAGQPITFSIIVTNTNDQPKTLLHGANTAADIAIIDLDGSQRWSFLPPVIADEGSSSQLLPGESTTFPVLWSGFDHDGNIVPPGDYLVRGFFHFGFNRAETGGKYVPHDLSTAPREILIVGN